MSESYEYLQETVKELRQRITRQDEIISWDAEKLVEHTTKIVKQGQEITTLNQQISTLQARNKEQDATIASLRADLENALSWYEHWQKIASDRTKEMLRLKETIYGSAGEGV